MGSRPVVPMPSGPFRSTKRADDYGTQSQRCGKENCAGASQGDSRLLCAIFERFLDQNTDRRIELYVLTAMRHEVATNTRLIVASLS